MQGGKSTGGLWAPGQKGKVGLSINRDSEHSVSNILSLTNVLPELP